MPCGHRLRNLGEANQPRRGMRLELPLARDGPRTASGTLAAGPTGRSSRSCWAEEGEMKKNGRLGCWLGAGVVVLALICAALVGFAYWQSRSTAFASRPLVLIHSPVNHERVQTGDRVQVHATARAQRGLRRVELWADDVFVGAQDAEEGQRPNMLVFAGSWVPTVGGESRADRARDFHQRDRRTGFHRGGRVRGRPRQRAPNRRGGGRNLLAREVKAQPGGDGLEGERRRSCR